MLKFIQIVFFLNIALIQIYANDDMRTIHVFVALCDNENQGIIPVPVKIGNGQDAFNNLYWGAGYGVRNYFDKESDDWKLVKILNNPEPEIIERIVFKHSTTNIYLIADAYKVKEIKKAIADFLSSSSGNFNTTILIDSCELNFGGGSNLIAYIGHNGLMDFDIDITLDAKDTNERDVIILACYSKKYFYNFMKQTNAYPLIWSSGLMSPEAYTLEWALDGWVLNETGEQIRERAAQAYNNYQKCGIRGARNLLLTGW